VLVYLPIFLFAILEGEIYYITMCVAVYQGKLHWAGVLVSGALGGATGDQIWFYLLRGRIHWLDRYPWMARHRDAVVHRVKDNQNLILVISRFLPGLRTAIPIASAYAGLRPLHYSSESRARFPGETIVLVV
jgi:membrane protein DedA with SNARE-associated domain